MPEGGERIDWENYPAVERKPGRLAVPGLHRYSGAGYARFENLASGATVDEFVEWFPGVDKQPGCAVLEHEAMMLRKELAR